MTTLTKESLRAYRDLVTTLEKDLHAQVDASATLHGELEAAWGEARRKQRTGDSFAEWLDAYLTQIAVAWVLTTIFARFLEDNALVDDPWIAAEGQQKARVDDTYRHYFQQNPMHSDNDYLHAAFRRLAALPAGGMFARARNPLYRLKISGDAGQAVLRFFNEVDPDTGRLVHCFQTHAGDTRFLGDLYQDLSEDARKRYALLQTPEFVEEFILEHTLLPAIDTFGIDEVRFIDPTCGSGHFLLGGFHTILAQKLATHPGKSRAVLVREALEATHGVDLNPFAVAIARFRLTIAALFALDDNLRLDQAPRLPLNIATGDALIHGRQFPRWHHTSQKLGHQTELFQYALDDRYNTEDNDLIFGTPDHPGILMQQYHAVVGNPPYITVSDKAVSETYRRHYDSCHRKYALVCPFYERFFDLAIGKEMPGEEGSLLVWKEKEVTPGYVGMIVANSFMKRSFGAKLVEEIIPRTDLTHVIDTSGAYIPGHGTPTVILFGRNQNPANDTVRGVLGIRGEPKTPDDASQGHVWSSIAAHINESGFEDDFISVDDIPRKTLHQHPWTLRGGGALDAKAKIESGACNSLNNFTEYIGITAVTGEDDLYILNGLSHAVRKRIYSTYLLVVGETIRDWTSPNTLVAAWPFDFNFNVFPLNEHHTLYQFLWPAKYRLIARKQFGTPMLKKGLTWYEWQELYTNKLQTPLSITFAFVATHNHFVLDRGGKVFKRSAPVIKLPADATVDDHLGLLGLLNSSTACFWMKMNFFNKGYGADSSGARTRDATFEDFYEHDGTKMKLVPIPDTRPLELAWRLDGLGQRMAWLEPAAVAGRGVPTAAALDEAKAEADAVLGQMIALQEELDWACYAHYGLLSDPPLAPDLAELPPIKLGERAFEIVLARKMKAGTVQTSWFKRHKSKPITQIPARWPAWYRDIVQARIDRIQDTQFVRLIEQPEFKRRWNLDPWKKREEDALTTWLLDRLETRRYIPQAPDALTLTADPDAPRAADVPAELTPIADLAREARRDEHFQAVAARLTGDPTCDLDRLVHDLILSESVPFLPSQRYKPSGIRRRRDWEKVWALQRREDAGETDLDIPKPPTYRQSDFQSASIYKLRGKLDVPRERFTLYPGCHLTDPTAPAPSPMVTWAGLDHLQRARALATFYYQAKDTHGWPPDRLLPLLAGLKDLLPWLHQWHPQVDPTFGQSFGEFIQSMLDEQAHELGVTFAEIDHARLG